MAVTNHERVNKALNLVQDAIRPEVERKWRGQYGLRWVEQVRGRIRHHGGPSSPDDLAFLLRGMDATWDQFFRHTQSRSTRSYLHLLWEARNEWAHTKRFSSDETLRILDHCEMMLLAFQSGEAAEEVQELKRTLLRQVYAAERRTAERRAAAGATKGEPLAGLKPWREVITPHPDVREGRFAQAEFAADLRQVVRGEAASEYGDPTDFYARTFITDGLRDLIRNAARRLSGQGGDPVVELQTGFGGGKTHSLIALYHLASGRSGLPGVGETLEEDYLSVPEEVRRAVFTGQLTSPSSPVLTVGDIEIRTMWGYIAYQLGGVEGYRMVADDDRNATNPGDKLMELFRRYGPVLILIDEWVAYARGLPMTSGERLLPAGDFDTQFTFAQALTEAVASVDDALLVVSVPASSDPSTASGDPREDSLEIGGEKGRMALDRLGHVLARKASQWQPSSSEESFEIVRRRLFEPLESSMARHRDAVVKAYHRFYLDNAGEFPPETREGDYLGRMEAAYPIHPEFFDRLYQDWSTLERFQRTRGVLRLMASVISELWDRDDKSLMIMPGVVPMDSAKVVTELTRYVDDRWKPIIDADVDGPGSLPLRFDRDRKNLGRYWACRRVARATYLGSAPLPVDRRGIDRTRIVLGCVQPGERPGVFGDALRHLAGEATYLYNQQMRYWYDTKPSLTKMAADRALSNFSDDDADIKLGERIQRTRAKEPLGAVHVFPDGPGDVPDEDDRVRLVILPPRHYHERGVKSPAEKTAQDILEQRRGGPRINRNLLVFLAAEKARVPELRQAIRSRMAWQSILDDQGEFALNLTPADVSQAETRKREADRTVDLRIEETFSQVLYPVQAPGQSEIRWAAVRASSSGNLAERVARKLESSEHLIPRYHGTRVRRDLDRRDARLWKGPGGGTHIRIQELWSYYCRYLYMPRLAGFGVLAAAISGGVASISWQTETFAYAESYDEESDRYLGLQTGQHVDVTRSQEAVLVHPERTWAQIQADSESPETGRDDSRQPGKGSSRRMDDGKDDDVDVGSGREEPSLTRFYGQVELDSVRAIRDLESILKEVVSHLRRAGKKVTISVEVNAEADGFDTHTVRVVSENATQLGFTSHEFEE
ncbi:MAG: DUF499 domain-containing protein [Caldilineaceae bacterium]|nr:DUF499 domain-containing protein [Caldilineaceae bacterium]MDE0500622.1 DUF499 domain-containing protein [bacterium]